MKVILIVEINYDPKQGYSVEVRRTDNPYVFGETDILLRAEGASITHETLTTLVAECIHDAAFEILPSDDDDGDYGDD